jgi:hypothetical protein
LIASVTSLKILSGSIGGIGGIELDAAKTISEMQKSLAADFVPNWEFTNELAIDQPATFSFRINFSNFTSCHALLRHKWVILIRSPLLVKWCNAEAAAIGDDIANPLRLQWTGTCSAFSAGYQSP